MILLVILLRGPFLFSTLDIFLHPVRTRFSTETLRWIRVGILKTQSLPRAFRVRRNSQPRIMSDDSLSISHELADDTPSTHARSSRRVLLWRACIRDKIT
jgi:hypothetical protein